MQITQTTDYAIRSVLYLSDKDQPVSLKELGEAIHVSSKYISTMIYKMIQAGIIYSIKGKKGGYLLARSPANIRVYDIVSAMENTMYINRCLEEDHYCTRGAAKECPVRKYYEKLQNTLEKELKGVTIEEIIAGEF